MLHRLATPEGKKLYARRKHTPEPVFGIIKAVLGFRQFLLRGLDKVRGNRGDVNGDRRRFRGFVRVGTDHLLGGFLTTVDTAAE
jgi:DDE family transposase